LDSLVDDFNNYAKINNIDIHVDRIVSSSLNNNSTTVESILKENISGYDIFLVNTYYTHQYFDYVSDLRKYVSNDLIKKYLKNKTLKLSFHCSKLVGLVIY